MNTFERAFGILTGNPPFPWQQELYRLFRDGPIPDSCRLPTGLGKTAVIPIWLIALATAPLKVPRRLVYVVNRRTVVDQATREAEKVRANLAQAPELLTALKGLCAAESEPPLAISTLRGQFADNREWSADPSRPAVVVGTVDMIGSRLLFSGYGVGFKANPLHAGFLGQDVLLVHDEAHLEPAFQKLIEAIRDEQLNEPAPLGQQMRLKVMELSATSRGDGVTLRLEKADYAHPEVKKRIEARKAIYLHESKDQKNLADEITDLALRHKESGRAVLVFVRKVEDVEKTVARLRKEKQNAQQLTGTLRGKERDQLVDDPIFARFLPAATGSAGIEPTKGTVYLVCTSAGEVGVNISADHLVCDLAPFDSMAQRFGRVNRFGDRDDTRIDIVCPKQFANNEYEIRCCRTLELLWWLAGDGSPNALDKLPLADRQAAFTPEPNILRTSDILFDVWALTTVRSKLPGRPPVEPYLHGLSSEPPETHVAWREEVGVLRVRFRSEEERNKQEAEARKRLAKFAGELLEDYPLKPHELLREPSYRAFKHFETLAQRHPAEPVWLLDDEGKVDVFTLAELTNKDKKDRIEGKTVLLPPSAGGLEKGMLSGNSDHADDVADEWLDENDQPRRWRGRDETRRPADFERRYRLVREIVITDPEDEDAEPDTWEWYARPRSADDDGSKSATDPIRWQHHTDDVERNAKSFADALLKEHPSLHTALILAARFHDLGKKRVVWQKSIGNLEPSNWLAKSGRGMKPRELTTYRHEFGSLVDLEAERDFLAVTDEDVKDLIRHLIAVHHGRGRPHFPADEAFDPEPKGRPVDEAAAEVPRRFARLQRKYGRWGLAYLESLLRAADYAASANPSKERPT